MNHEIQVRGRHGEAIWLNAIDDGRIRVTNSAGSGSIEVDADELAFAVEQMKRVSDFEKARRDDDD